MAGSSPRLQNALIRQLKINGIAVKRHAEAAVSGRYTIELIRGAKSETLAVQLAVTASDYLGRKIAEFNASLADEREASILLSATASFPTNAGFEERQARLRQSLFRPKHEIQGATVYSGPERLYGMEICTNNKPVIPKMVDDEPVCPIPRESHYTIRLFNNSPYEAAVRINVDGLSIFDFSSELETTVEYLVPPRMSVEVPGWYINRDLVKLFTVGKYPEQPNADSLSAPKIGSISSVFAASWSKDRERPADEPNPRSIAETGIGVGMSVDLQQVRVKRQVGIVRGVVSIRYGDF